jgi:hypothetical protein
VNTTIKIEADIQSKMPNVEVTHLLNDLLGEANWMNVIDIEVTRDDFTEPRVMENGKPGKRETVESLVHLRKVVKRYNATVEDLEPIHDDTNCIGMLLAGNTRIEFFTHDPYTCEVLQREFQEDKQNVLCK